MARDRLTRALLSRARAAAAGPAFGAAECLHPERGQYPVVQLPTPAGDSMASIFDSDLALGGDRATETAHRKIELQSPDDLTYLIANVSHAAREKLDKHLPPDAAPDGEDAMRKRVEQLVDDVGDGKI